jgi:precorrin-6B methylase 2
MTIIKQIFKDIYNRLIRPRLPYKIGVYNGIPLYKAKLLDMSGEYDHNLEEGLLNALRNVVSEGDRVVIVGGGYGLSSITSSEKVGEKGEVVTFEAGEEQSKVLKKNIELNNATHNVTVNHSPVGSATHSYSKIGNADITEPSELPTCDVLILDCEGAEYEIIEGMQIRPQNMVVETHGFLDSPAYEIVELAESKGYLISERKSQNENLYIEVLTIQQE